MNIYLQEESMKYNPEIELRGSGNTDYGHNLAERILREQKEQGDLEKLVDLESEIKFVSAVEKSGVDVNNKFSERYEKERLIRKYALYTKLNGLGKQKESLKNCSDHKIGSAFKNLYYSALRKIENYDGERENEKLKR